MKFQILIKHSARCSLNSNKLRRHWGLRPISYKKKEIFCKFSCKVWRPKAQTNVKLAFCQTENSLEAVTNDQTLNAL